MIYVTRVTGAYIMLYHAKKRYIQVCTALNAVNHSINSSNTAILCKRPVPNYLS